MCLFVFLSWLRLEHKGYHCWDPISNIFLILCHVSFQENTIFSSISTFHHPLIIDSIYFTDPSVELLPSFNVDNSNDLNTRMPSPTHIKLVTNADNVYASRHFTLISNLPPPPS